MRTRVLLLLFLAVSVLVSVTGCKTKSRVLRTTDGHFELTVPGGWRTSTTLNDGAQIQAEGSEGYVIVLTDAKEDLENPALGRYADGRAKVISEKLGQATVGPAVPTTVNGRPAMAIELSGFMKGVGIAYLLTTVETPDHLHQILTWTTKSKFAGGRARFVQIAGSFRETGK